MAHYDLITGLDLLHAALLDAGEAASITGRYGDDARRAVRTSYWSVLAHARWPWALSPTPNVITTVAKRDVTVLSISGATPAVVTLSASISTTMAGRKFYLEGNQSVYRVNAHTAGTALLTLDAGYVETETAGPAVIFQDEYQLPSTVLKVWDPFWPRGWQHEPIKLWDKPLFEQRFGRGAWGLGSGIIEAACEINPSAYDNTAQGVIRRVRFAPWSDEALNIEHDYTVFHTLDFSGSGDGDTPRIPKEHREVVAHFATAKLCVSKDESKAADYATMGGGKLAEMVTQYLPAQDGRMHVHPKHSAALGLT